MIAAIAGWLYGVWPANPLTLGVAALLVVGGPLLGIVHVATADEDDEEEAPTVVMPAVVPRPAPEPVVLTPKAAAARRFAAWRDRPHPAIERRERERRASQYIRG
jgi:hypothetical protein